MSRSLCLLLPIQRIARLAASVLLLGAIPVSAQEVADPSQLSERYPRGSIASVEAADQALAEISRAREAVRAQFAREEQACQPNFFVTSCVDKAKEKQRQSLQLLRSIELESNQVKRQARAAKSDSNLAEKQEQAEKQQLEMVNRTPQPAKAAKTAASERAAPANKPATNDERVAEHEARMQALQAKEDAEAPKRAAKAEAYDRKVQASLKRQEEVARRRAEKQAKQAAREKSAATPAVPLQPGNNAGQ